ncbi:ABC transporter substrate-binding protein [Tranquillimonas alkanivorans]|uniref:Amino acid/amide ABC transporter substrate-binding protein, HAAT family n=1 Tax=Tranquillimonas alkanivorans TaxID=441119 RepID=A0A1I5UNL9_9RHOB|nr:ABC transporter substrate-binding protein [Tranquillimonas alkanivorans]SFP96924.1 amino acid/amide ABC transporter substrate-binding protein, HAAT family [Tranquillimonas alkanivorans]
MNRTAKLAATLSVSLAATAGAVSAQDAIKIGGIAPLSPPGGVQTGESLRDGMIVAVEELNANGGILGQPVELIVEDTSGVPEKGVAAFERLATAENVVGVTGSAHSAVCSAVGPVAQETNTVFVAGECWSDSVTAAQIPEVFRITVANSLVYSVAADWVKEAGFENIAIISENSDWGFGIIDVFTENLKDTGATVTSFTAERTVSDFTPQLLQLKRADPQPDLIVAGFTGSNLLLMLRQAYDLGLAPSPETAIFAAGADVLEPEFWDVMGDAGKYVIGNPAGLPGKPDTPLSRSFGEAYQQKFDRPANAVAMEGYDGVMVLAEAIEAAGTTDSDAVEEALRNLSWDGTRGTIFFPQTKEPAWAFQQWPEVPIFVIQYSEANQTPSEAEILWPKSQATTDEIVLKP